MAWGKSLFQPQVVEQGRLRLHLTAVDFAKRGSDDGDTVENEFSACFPVKALQLGGDGITELA